MNKFGESIRILLFFTALSMSLSTCSPAQSEVLSTSNLQRYSLQQDVSVLRNFRRDAGVDVTHEKVQLTRSFLVQDEIGNTDQHNQQPLSETMWAKKSFVVPYIADAELLFFGGKIGAVIVNGHTVPEAQQVPSTRWMRIKVPAAWLRAGENEVVFSGSGSLLIENSLFPDRSARSTDGGKTWSSNELGPDGIHNGEYVVRLRLQAYAPAAVITSDVIDVFGGDDNAKLQPRAQVNSVRLALSQASSNAMTTLKLQTRQGSTLLPQNSSWGAWNDVVADKKMDVSPTARYLQWRVRLQTNSGQETPSFAGVEVSAAIQSTQVPEKVRVTEVKDYPLIESSYPFAYQPESTRLKLLRSRYKLDEVIASGKTELEKLVLLRNWVRNQWPNGWAHNDLKYCPPWDALLILDMAPREQALGMCTHYSTVFVQCALALGWNARHLVLDHHCAGEVWMDELGKWILMDTGNSRDPLRNCHFAHDGVPLNAMEIRELWRAEKLDQIQVVYVEPTPTISGAQAEEGKVQFGFSNYRRFAIPFRNNHLDTPFPGELEQGDSAYFHDGYLWWQDEPLPTDSPEYSRLSYRKADFYANLNQIELDLQDSTASTPDAPELKVELSTNTPNFSHFLFRLNDGQWQQQKSNILSWKLQPGRNRLEVKTVNVFNREGRPSRAVVEVED